MPLGDKEEVKSGQLEIPTLISGPLSERISLLEGSSMLLLTFWTEELDNASLINPVAWTLGSPMPSLAMRAFLPRLLLKLPTLLSLLSTLMDCCSLARMPPLPDTLPTLI